MSVSAVPAEMPADWRAVDWRAHQRSIELDGARVSYVELGSDEPAVLFVHGLGAQWRVWLENLPAVATRSRAVAVDLPGFGGSEPGQGTVSIRRYAELLDRFCERVGLGAVVVVGNSMGGFVAAELALIAPQRVKGLVLVDAAGMVPSRTELRRAIPILRGMILVGARMSAAARPIAARPRLRHAALRMIMHDPRRVAPDLTYWALLAPPGPATKAALAASFSYLTHEWGAQLREVRCPTLILWGEGDALIPVRHADEYARKIPGARVVTFPSAGHLPMVERPDLFNRVLLEFLDSLDDPHVVPHAG